MTELDLPGERGYDWQKLSERVKREADYVCQCCGRPRKSDEWGYIGLVTHHIVKGRHLPKTDARLWVNLVAVCDSCHGRLEGNPYPSQFREVGRELTANVLEMLNEGRVTPGYVSNQLGVGMLEAFGQLEYLCRLQLAMRLYGMLYERRRPRELVDDPREGEDG